MAELTPYQQDILIRTALGEARGEGAEGMADVMQVILNRANSGRFPSDPAKVALQDKQFSTWNSGKGGNNPQQFSANSPVYQEAKRALDAVVSGARPDPTGGALFYHAPSVKPSWSSSVNRNGTIERNGHVFYPSHPVPPGEIPSVASLLDTRRTPPNPVALSSSASSVRQMTSPTGGNNALQEALNRVATVQRNQVTPASADDRITARNRAWVQNNPAPVVAPSSSDAARRAALSMSGNQSMAGMERAPVRVVAPTPASVDDRLNARNLAQTQAINPIVAAVQPSIPQSFAGQERATVSANPIGQAPATRIVQSVPVRGNVPQSFAGQESGPAWGGVAPAASLPERLMPSSALPPANFGGLTPQQVNSIGVPSPANPAPAVRTAMATQAMPPMPRARPQVAQQIAAPQQLIARALAPAPLQISVNGANRVAQALSPQSFSGVSTGRIYTPGSTVTMNGDRLLVNPNGSFTNERTGNTLTGSSGGGRSLVETPDGMQWR